MMTYVTSYVWFHAPVPVEVFEPRMPVEEAAVPATHVTVADHPTLANANGSKILQAVHEPALVDPVRQ